MTDSELDPRRLQQLVSPAVDAVCAHRMACGRTPDIEQLTAIREALEDHVLQALKQVDLTVMPRDWSWEKAAEAFAAELAEVLMARGGSGPLEGP